MPNAEGAGSDLNSQLNASTTTISINAEEFIFGILAVHVLTFACILMVIAACPFLLLLLAESQIIENLSSSTKGLNSDNLHQFFWFMTIIFVSIIYNPIRLCFWGSKQYLKHSIPGIIVFSTIWIAWDYIFSPKNIAKIFQDPSIIIPTICLVSIITMRFFKSVRDLKNKEI